MDFNFNINALLPQEICEVHGLLENCSKDKTTSKEKIQVKLYFFYKLIVFNVLIN